MVRSDLSNSMAREPHASHNFPQDKKVPVRRVPAIDEEDALKKARSAYKNQRYEIDTRDLPEVLNDYAKFSFLACRDKEQVAVTVITKEDNPQDKHWQEMNQTICGLTNGTVNSRFEIWQPIPHKRLKAALFGTAGLTIISAVLSPVVGKLVPSNSPRPLVIYIVSPPGLAIQTEQPDVVVPSNSETRDQTDVTTSRSAYDQHKVARSTPSVTNQSGASLDSEDVLIQQDIQKYLNQTLGPYVKSANLTDVRLMLTQPLSYSPGDGTATCTVDGSIESDQRTLLQSNSYPGTSAGQGTNVQLIEDACHNAIDQMVLAYRQVM